MEEDKRFEPFLDRTAILKAREHAYIEDKARVHEILQRAIDPDRSRFDLLPMEDLAALMAIQSPDLLQELFEAAGHVKNRVYGKRIVLFQPLYDTNECVNNCRECAFSITNRKIKRRALSNAEVIEEAKALVHQGQKRVLLIGGEDPSDAGFQAVVDHIDALYSVREPKGGQIWRVNLNIAPVSTDQFRVLKEHEIGTYQLFQETYDEEIYKYIHISGPKADMSNRLFAFHRAMDAGIGDIGMGVQLGLGDWRYDILALHQHIAALQKTFGAGCHTISVPRTEPALGSDFSITPPNAVSDEDFKKIVAILRVAVPYTGIIMSTRETPEMRAETLALGVSQVSGGSHTEPGGYAALEKKLESFKENAQFVVSDNRSLDAVIRDVAKHGYIPSFCVGCERKGRMGTDFFKYALDGSIHNHCTPNALVSAYDFGFNYALQDTRKAIELVVANETFSFPQPMRQHLFRQYAAIQGGAEPVFC